MEKEFETDLEKKIDVFLEKILDWKKKLGEQSDFIKKAIDPLLTWELAYKIDMIENSPTETGNIDDKEYWKKYFNKNPNDVKEYILYNCEVPELFNHLSPKGVFVGDDKPVVEKLISLGIKGCLYADRIDIFDDDYLKKINLNHEKYFKYNWEDTDELPGLENFIGEYLKFDLGKDNHNLDSYFVVGHVNEPPNPEEPEVFHTKIMFFRTGEDIEDHKPKFSLDSNLDFNTAKNIVEKTAEHFNVLVKYNVDFTFNEMKENIIRHQIPKHAIITDDQGLVYYNNNAIIPEQSPASGRQLETAQKTGYVQGVCESVLAFNTEENRKIMSDSTMAFLSKKLLAEMNVTKDMAQKFANPETYKALEQCVFAPAQEQRLEQTQSQGIRR